MIVHFGTIDVRIAERTYANRSNPSACSEPGLIRIILDLW